MPISPEAAHHRARVASLTRAVRNGERPADDPELADAHQHLKSLRITEFVQRQLAEAPPLTDQQRDQLAELLRPVRRGGAQR